MVSVIEALFLGVLQGITEWLPVSSSAHLALAQHYLGIEAPVSFDVALHLGTILAVFAYYKNDLASLACGILARNAKDLRFAGLLAITTIPTAVIGFAFKGVFESMFTSPPAIATALAITGVFLIIASRVAGRAEGSAQPDAKSSFIIGVAQGIAVAPGISRSGATIGTALLLGIKKEEAARFSFLAGIVPILGASLLEGRKAALGEVEFLPLAIGLATAAIIGYLFIGILLRFLKESRLQWFGYYCLTVAALVLASSLL